MGEDPSQFLIEVRDVPSKDPPPIAKIRGRVEGGRFVPPRGNWVMFEGAHATQVDFQRAHFAHFASEASSFVECDFRRAKLPRAAMGGAQQTVFERCLFDEADLRYVRADNAKFVECSFDNAKIKEWFWFCAELVDCHFAGRIERSKFAGRPFGPCAERIVPPRSENEFRGNDFSGADLVDVSFVFGIDLGGQRWPEDDRYLYLEDAAKKIRRARSEVIRWPAGEERQDALIILEILESSVETGQKDLFVRPDTFSREVDLHDSVWNLLRKLAA